LFAAAMFLVALAVMIYTVALLLKVRAKLKGMYRVPEVTRDDKQEWPQVRRRI
jgi:hypothetical protein